MRRAFMTLTAALLAANAVAATLPLYGIGGSNYSVPVTSMREARFRSTLHQQYDFSCGSAALATLLTHHYDHPVSEQAVFAQMFAQGDQARIRREGFSLLDMKRYLATQGFEADGFRQSLDKLAGAGLPAIALINEHGYHHFIVIKGMRDGRVLIGDPASGVKALPRARFEAMWVNRLLFVIHSQQQRALFNRESDWAGAPRAPLVAGINRDGLGNVTLPRMGPGEF